jgi:alpha-galactosidase
MQQSMASGRPFDPKAAGSEWVVTIRGDMLGDKPLVNETHIRRAAAVYPLIARQAGDKFVIAVGGPSGSGKSEIASLLASRFAADGKAAYVLSCDNYPHRPPRENDANREALFAQGGEQALVDYLGTQNEIDFSRLAAIVAAFQRGEGTIPLRIMNAQEHFVQDDAHAIDFSKINVLVLEGTWSHLVAGTNVRLYLQTNFEETLAHRKARGRDSISPFGERVLRIEQKKLDRIAQAGHLVAHMDGRVDKVVDLSR